MENAWLELAIEACQRNEMDRALGLLQGYVRYNSKDENGWIWLSHVVVRREEKIQYLQRALQIDPTNDFAKKQIAALTGRVIRPASHPVGRTYRIGCPGSSRVPLRQRVGGSAPRLGTSSIGAVLRWVAFGLGGVLFFAVAVAMLPMALGDRSLVIMSGSMEPMIPVGSLAMVEPVPSANLQTDDIIAYKPDETMQMPIVHRIVSVEMRQGVRYYVTRGDANTGADAELALPPTAWRVFFDVPFIGYIVSSTSSSVMSILLIGVPIFLIPLLSALEWLMKKRLAPLPVRTA